MLFARLLILAYVTLALANVNHSSDQSICGHGPQEVSFLAGDFQVIKKAVTHDSGSPHDLLPAITSAIVLALPEPACHPRAASGCDTVRLKYAYISKFSGLSPPAAIS